tara:strand:+ start:152 stop:610 length:459 start_codon:yes stop_codon:yes gene_type:complete
MAWDAKIDIWSLGCVLVELWTGSVLLENDSVPTMLARAIGIFGPIPSTMLAKGSDTVISKYFLPDGTVFEAMANSEKVREGEEEELAEAEAEADGEEASAVMLLIPKNTSLAARMRCPNEELLDFLRALLQWDPALRPTATEALGHAFICTL